MTNPPTPAVTEAMLEQYREMRNGTLWMTEDTLVETGDVHRTEYTGDAVYEAFCALFDAYTAALSAAPAPDAEDAARWVALTAVASVLPDERLMFQEQRVARIALEGVIRYADGMTMNDFADALRQRGTDG